MAIGPDLATLYVADTGNHTIRSVRIVDGVVSTLAGLAEDCGSAGRRRYGRPVLLPVGVAADTTHLYVADNENHTIRKVTLAGFVTTLAGTAGEYGTADGTGSSARFHHPRGRRGGWYGYYVADYSGQTIRKVGTLPGW